MFTDIKVMSQSSILRRKHWTPKKIQELLGTPDLIEENIHNSLRPVKLYLARKVLQAEQSPEFRASKKLVQLRG